MSTALEGLGLTADRGLEHGRRRLRLLALGFCVAFASVGLRLVGMVPWSGPITAAIADSEERVDPRMRPDIIDRNGQLLATDLRIPSVFADPLVLPDQAQAARDLAGVLAEVDARTLERRFAAARRFAWVKHQVTPEEQRRLLELGIPGVGFKTAQHRVYPSGHAAAHLLGYVDIDNRGLAGVEHGLDNGKAARPTAGQPLALSIDARVQEVVAAELGRAYTRFKAKGACGIVLDSLTGEVVALVSLPDFDPNRIEAAGPEQRRNRCTGGSYELGSIFKIVAHAMALDSGKVSLRDHFDATGKLSIGRFKIGDDHAKNRVLSVPEIFIYSSNIGTARMAFAAGGAAPLKAFIERLGFQHALPLEIPEVAGPQMPRRWAEVTTATVSFGHGMAVSPMHFASVIGALAGDGTLIAPTLLRRDPASLPERRRVVSRQTADDIRSLMWLTVMKGTGTRGKVEGYLVGGKTGTAEKAGRRGYRHDAVLASFAAVFPIERPRYVVLALLDEPRGDASTHGYRYGGWTAAPVVAEIIARAGPLLGVPRSTPEAEVAMRERAAVTRILTAAAGGSPRQMGSTDRAPAGSGR